MGEGASKRGEGERIADVRSGSGEELSRTGGGVRVEEEGEFCGDTREGVRFDMSIRDQQCMVPSGPVRQS